MNTQAHAVLNVALLARWSDPRTAVAVAFGSVIPDLQIVGFYIVEKALYQTPEREIWERRYFEVHEWFDWMNSIPLALAGVLVAHGLGRPGWRGFFAGLFLHCCFDLPLHNDDAHRHFLPFTSWRFHSPLSYWDPAHYGVQVTLFELTAVAVASVVVWRSYPGRATAAGLGLVWLLYGAIATMVAVFWSAG